MAGDGNFASSDPIAERILAIRERWHTKRHTFFLAFGEGKLPLKALGAIRRCTTTSCRGHWRVSGCFMRGATTSRKCGSARVY
jgi:hypothetical protein